MSDQRRAKRSFPQVVHEYVIVERVPNRPHRIPQLLNNNTNYDLGSLHIIIPVLHFSISSINFNKYDTNAPPSNGGGCF